MFPGKVVRLFFAAIPLFLAAVLSAPEARAQPCQTPNMLIIHDISASMGGSVGGMTKLEAAKAAVKAVTDKYGGSGSALKIRFGLELFATPDQPNYPPSNTCNRTGSGCPNNCLADDINIPIGDGNSAEIQAKLVTVSPWSNTPMRQALASANGYAGLLATDRQNFVLLVTDGRESCEVREGSPCPNCVNEVTRLYGKGIKTYVVGFGSGVDPNNLNQMAAAGHTDKAGTTKYYQADNAAELESALDQIASQVASGDCTVSGQTGECAKGYKQCVSGVVTCVPVRLPNSCGICEDTRPCLTECGQGTETCSGGQWVGCSAKQPPCGGCGTPGNPGEGLPCDTGKPGICAAGVTSCVGDSMVCLQLNQPGSEACNGIDVDCDVVVDNGVRNACGGCGEIPAGVCIADGASVCDGFEVCKPGQLCLNGRCVSGCINNECPVGYTCREYTGALYCLRPCDDVTCAPGLACDQYSGSCYDPCQGIQCPEEQQCRQGVCVSKDCHEGGCPEGSVCLNGSCAKDPCQSAGCTAEQQCSNGVCTASCATVSCSLWQHCEMGKCIGDSCDKITCPGGQTCRDGVCENDACATVPCGKGYVCSGGTCVDDPCLTIKCPIGQLCTDGNCRYSEIVTDGGTASDGSVSPDGGTGPGSNPDGSTGNSDASGSKDGAEGQDGGTPDPGTIPDGSGATHSSGCSCSAVGI